MYKITVEDEVIDIPEMEEISTDMERSNLESLDKLLKVSNRHNDQTIVHYTHRSIYSISCIISDWIRVF